MAIHILSLTFHIHDVGRALLFSLWKHLQMNLAPLRWTVDSGFARHIMITHSRPLRHFHDVYSKVRCRCFLLSIFVMKKCKCWPLGNKESKNQPLGDNDNILFRIWNVKFRMFIAIKIAENENENSEMWANWWKFKSKFKLFFAE